MSDDTRPERDAAASLRRLLGNALSLLLAYVLPRILTIGAVILAARVLGAAGFGEYGTAAALAVLLSIVATLGMQPLLIREMARAPERAGSWMRAAHVVKLFSSALMLIALALAAGPGLGYPREVASAALILGAGYAIGAFAENLAAYFQSIERMSVWMQASACYGLVTGAAGAILVATTRSVVWFCVAPVAGQIASVAWLAIRAPRGVRLGPSMRKGDAGVLLRAMVPFALGFIALTAHSKVDVLLLAHWWPSEQVGVYTAAHKFIDIVQALAVVASAAIYPRLSRITDTQAAHRGTTRLAELTLFAGLAVGGGLWLARTAAVNLLFGAGYTPAIAVTGVMAIGIPALALNIVSGYALAAAGRMKQVALLYGGALALKVALNVWLVPQDAAMGTATALAATELALAAGMALLLRRAFRVQLRARTLVTAVAAVAACAAASFLRDPTGGMIAAAGFAVFVLVATTSAGVVPRSDRALLAAALRGVPRGAQ